MNIYNPDQINVTEAAQERFADIVQSGGVSLSLKESGCTGYKYVWEEIENRPAGNHILEFDNWFLSIDNKSYNMLKGATIDLKHVNFGHELTVTSPQIEAQCGCGESVSFKQ